MITLLLVFVLCVCLVAWRETRSKKHNEDKKKRVKSMKVLPSDAVLEDWSTLEEGQRGMEELLYFRDTE